MIIRYRLIDISTNIKIINTLYEEYIIQYNIVTLRSYTFVNNNYLYFYY